MVCDSVRLILEILRSSFTARSEAATETGS